MNQLAAQAYSGFNKEGSGSRESLHSQADPNLVVSEDGFILDLTYFLIVGTVPHRGTVMSVDMKFTM